MLQKILLVYLLGSIQSILWLSIYFALNYEYIYVGSVIMEIVHYQIYGSSSDVGSGCWAVNLMLKY
jgi:hypothetical protein